MGNPISITTQSSNNTQAQTQRKLTYGARGQLTQLTDNNRSTDYRYNHAMQRVSKTTDANTKDKNEQRYLWEQGLLDAEIDVKNNQERITRRYVYVGLRPIAMIAYEADKTPSIYTVHTDHLGTPQQVSNEQQEIVWQGEYDSFGQVTVKVNPENKTQDIQAKQKGWLLNLMNSANAVESVTNQPFEFNLRFAGQYEDSESGYYYNWHRYYNPETGRYLTSDPIGLNGGLNTYGYAGANPVGAVDPWGLYSISQGGITSFFTGFKFLENFSIPTPPGWKDYNEKDKLLGVGLYHEYNRSVDVKDLTSNEQKSVQNYIVNHPTPPTTTKPATKKGTYNLASPNKGRFSGAAGAVAVLKNPDYVYSFLRTGTNGRPYIINVTAANHLLKFGIVIRGIECFTNGTTRFHNYGEGNGIVQSFGGLSNLVANDVWFWATEDALEKVTGRNYKVNGVDWTSEDGSLGIPPLVFPTL